MVSHSTQFLYFVLLICYIVASHGCTVRDVGDDRRADCSRQELTSVPTSLPYDVTVLILSGNKIKDVSEAAFRTYPRLRVVDLSYNRLVQVDWDYLPDSLEELDVSNNNVSEVCTRRVLKSDGLFKEESQTMSVQSTSSLIDNTLEHSNDSDTVVPRLRVLNLDQNMVHRLSGDCFSGLGTSIEILTLSNNRLDVVLNHTFRGLVKLQQLNLEKNQIAELEVEALT